MCASTMDGRPHLLSVVDYQDLRTGALRFRTSDRELYRSAIRGEEREVHSCADTLSSGCRCDRDSQSRIADRVDERKEIETWCRRVKSVFGHEGIEQSTSFGEPESVGVENSEDSVNFLEEVRSKEAVGLLERPLGQENSKQEGFALGYGTRKTAEDDATGIMVRRSNFHEIHRTHRRNQDQRCDGYKTLDGRNLDITCKHSRVEMLETSAAGGGELARKIVAILGPSGPGLLAVRNVPGVVELRKRLLPLAKRLALMPDQSRRLVLKEHDLNTDVPLKRPDRPVSAFATQLRYGRHVQFGHDACLISEDCGSSTAGASKVRHEVSTASAAVPTRSQENGDEEELGIVLRHLGSLMVEVGLLIARLCDEVCPAAELENAILESGTAKGRLIHYHCQSESNLMSSGTSNGSTKREPSKVPKAVPALRISVKRSESEERASEIPGIPGNVSQNPETWQQWHFDYGLFTVLTSPLYLKWEPSAPQEEGTNPVPSCNETSCWTHAGGDHSGLIIMYQGVVQCVNIPPDCLVVQVGEAAQILSGGSLAAIAHCVCRPPQADVSRETFVVFLQPAWHRSLSPPPGSELMNVLHPRDEESARGNVDGSNRSNFADYNCERTPRALSETLGTHVEIAARADPAQPWSVQRTQLSQAVPPLASRWSASCTFAEFSKLTTRQYYGADGRQSRK